MASSRETNIYSVYCSRCGEWSETPVPSVCPNCGEKKKELSETDRAYGLVGTLGEEIDATRDRLKRLEAYLELEEQKRSEMKPIKVEIDPLCESYKTRELESRQVTVFTGDYRAGKSYAFSETGRFFDYNCDRFYHPAAYRPIKEQVKKVEEIVDSAMRGPRRTLIETCSYTVLRALMTLVAEGTLPHDAVVLHWFRRNPEDGKIEIITGYLDEAGRYGDWPETYSQEEALLENRYLDAAEKKVTNEHPTTH